MTTTITGASGTPLPSDVPHRTNPAPAVAETAHTPTPWYSARRTFNYGCYGHKIACLPHVANLSTVQSPMEIAYIPTDTDRDRANAAHIVRCVNSHEALAEELRSLVERCDEVATTSPDCVNTDAARKLLVSIGL